MDDRSALQDVRDAGSQTKKQSVSVKVIITAIAVLFSLAASVTTICFAYFHFRDTARQNLLQSTEFNLSLVSGLIAQDLQELNRLRTRSENDEAISAYLADAGATSARASAAYENLASIAQSTTAYRYLLRLIMVSEDGERILQTGSGTTNGRPVTTESIRLLGSLELENERDFWQGVYADPFTDVDPPAVLAQGGNVYHAEKMHRRAVGHSCLMVSLSLFREPLRNYQLPEGNRLFLTVEDTLYPLDDPLRSEQAPAPSEMTCIRSCSFFSGFVISCCRVNRRRAPSDSISSTSRASGPFICSYCTTRTVLAGMLCDRYRLLLPMGQETISQAVPSFPV